MMPKPSRMNEMVDRDDDCSIQMRYTRNGPNEIRLVRMIWK